MILEDLQRLFRNKLVPYYPQEEVDALFLRTLEQKFNYSRTDYFLNKTEKISPQQQADIELIVTELSSGKPIQHIFGETEFFGLSFNVSNDVLIPRQETEELVDLILKTHPNTPLTLLDIGTGSGCIPLSLKHHRTQWNVLSVDISSKALLIAKQNAEKLNLNTTFIQLDILSTDKYHQLPKCDIIVSNPPYVTESEKQLMHANVLEHDPHLALFVADNNPLLFYKAITELAQSHLNNAGTLYFEINEAFGNEMKNLLRDCKFQNITLIKDLNGKDRFVSGIKIDSVF